MIRRALVVMAAALALAGCGKKDANQPATVPAEVMDPGAPAGTTATTEPAAPADPVTPPATTAPPPAGSSASSAMSDADFEALMARVVAMFDAMGAAADKHGGDCGKLADALDKVITDHRPLVAEVKAFEKDPAMNQRGEAWLKDHQDRIMTPMMKVAGMSQRCADDPRFQKTMEKMNEL
jgi:hypothetical protein